MKLLIKLILILIHIYIWADYPYDSILDVTLKKNNELRCKAVIIAERFIVLPGHCVDLTKISIYKIGNLKYHNMELSKIFFTKSYDYDDLYTVFKVKNKFDVGDIIAFNGAYYSYLKKTIIIDKEVKDDVFIWKKVNNIYFIDGLNLLTGPYSTVLDFHDISFFMTNNLDKNDGENDIAGMNFSAIESIDKKEVDKYISQIIDKKWLLTTNDTPESIPFRANQEMNGCCGGKFFLIKLYNKIFNPKIKLSKILILCKKDLKCIKILGHNYSDHVAYSFRDLSSNKIMIVDPAIEDMSFELNVEGLSHYLDRNYSIDDLVYIIAKDNIYAERFFDLINEVETPKEVFKELYACICSNENFKHLNSVCPLQMD